MYKFYLYPDKSSIFAALDYFKTRRKCKEKQSLHFKMQR
jgi:hypothetical protein